MLNFVKELLFFILSSRNMAYYNFNLITRSVIMNAIKKMEQSFYLNTGHYEICDCDLGVNGLNDPKPLQNYIVRFMYYEHLVDVVHFVVKSDGTGNLDYIKLPKRENYEKIAAYVENFGEFWGVPIGNIQEKFELFFGEKHYFYIFKVK